MNNIRKIIEERLENAENDYHNTSGMIEAIIKTKLKGQIEAYQDCLNLMQPRTEQEILNDFEKLGYEIVCNSDRELILERNYREWIDRIRIDKTIKRYAKSQCFIRQKDIYTQSISMQEHKLLNELFEVIFDDK